MCFLTQMDTLQKNVFFDKNNMFFLTSHPATSALYHACYRTVQPMILPGVCPDLAQQELAFFCEDWLSIQLLVTLVLNKVTLPHEY